MINKSKDITTVNQNDLAIAWENYYRFIMQKSNFILNKEVDFRNEILRFITYNKQIAPFKNGTCYRIIESNKITEFLTNLRVKNKNLSLEYYIRLKYIKEDLSLGKSMLEYCSTRYLNQQYLDPLWLHWDIYHLHFKAQTDGRTGYLIFAMIKDYDIYMIDIKEHEQWADQDILSIVDENWPHLLIKPNSEIQGHRLTNDEIRCLRSNGCNTLLQLANGSNVMATSGVAGGNRCRVSTLYSIAIKTRLIDRIYSQIQHYNFDGFNPQYLYILDENTWAIVSINKECSGASLYHQGNLSLIMQDLENCGILDKTSKTIMVTDIAIALLKQTG
jgi:hypothetical protein